MNFTYFFFPENRFCHFMQIVSNGDNLHEISNPVSGENKENIINLLSAELDQKVVKIKQADFATCC